MSERGGELVGFAVVVTRPDALMADNLIRETEAAAIEAASVYQADADVRGAADREAYAVVELWRVWPRE